MAKHLERSSYWFDPTAAEAIARADRDLQNHHNGHTNEEHNPYQTNGRNRRRQDLSETYTQLQELNSRFPDERFKRDADKNPEFLAQRNKLLTQIRSLSVKHRNNKL